MQKNRNKNFPIGVFDSGLGGLTVVKELMRQLPWEDIVYYGDTARVPYGTKSKEAIVRFSEENTRVLLKHKVKMIVVAWNSCSSYALATLCNQFDVPILGVINPGALKAVITTHNNKVGVIATSATIQSQKYTKTIHQYNKGIKVYSQPCPLFVPLVEEGWMNKSVAVDVAKEYLAPLIRSKIDTLILGCTHYPLLKSMLQKVVGKNVKLIDSALEVAFKVKEMLGKTNLNRTVERKPKYIFLVSDRPQKFQAVAKTFLGRDISIKVEQAHV